MRPTVHGHCRMTPTKKTYTPEYKTYDGMKQRCLNPRHISYPRYGGKGIRVCQRWLDGFANFLEDMGPRPEGMTLDRIDGDGHYEPGNCRWATQKTQCRNRITTKLTPLLADWAGMWLSEGFTAKSIADVFGVRKETIANIRYGVAWKDVTEKWGLGNKGRRTLAPETIAAISAGSRGGESIRSLAKRFSCSRWDVYNALGVPYPRGSRGQPKKLRG